MGIGPEEIYSDILDRSREEKQMRCDVMAHARAKLRARFTILIEECKFRAIMVTVLKSMRFRRLHDR